MHADPLSQTFAALADPTRRAILARLALGQDARADLWRGLRLERFDVTAMAR